MPVFVQSGLADVLRRIRIVALIAVVSASTTRAQTPPPLQVRDEPVSPGASLEAAALLEFLHSVSGKWILSGQQETIDWFGADNAPELPYILATTGKVPAVRGFDFMFMSDSRNTYQRVADHMIEWSQRGGIVTSCFHWFAGPAGVYSGNPRQAFYTVDTNFDLTQALIAGTPNNAEFIAEMDEVAEELKKVRDAGVPVIWRPFHECNGGWFWWGAKGPAVFKQAWIFMFERFTQVHGLTNLLWCYNPTEAPGALAAWYPGDAYVDMVSLDIYPPTGTHPTYANQSTLFRNITGGAKPIALSENGSIPDPDQLFADGTTWTYFCTWNGYFTTDGIVNSNAFLQHVYNHPRVITLDELGLIRPRTDLAPSIVIEPAAISAPEGSHVALAVVASGSAPLSYQWRKNNAELIGETEASLRFESLSSTDVASYSVNVSNQAGFVASIAAQLSVSAENPVPAPARLVNLSTRGPAAGEGSEMIVGFVVEGPGAKRLLIRAVGPTLTEFGVSGGMADPKIRLTKPDGTFVASNDDWTFGNDGPALQDVFTVTGAFQLPGSTRDAALVIDLPPGGYTAVISGADSGSGVVLAEIFDADMGTSSRLINISTRGPVGIGDEVMIAGFVTEGSSVPQLLLRAAGPALAEFGVVGALSDPVLSLTTGSGAELAVNDNWDAGADANALAAAVERTGAFPFAAGSLDSAMLAIQSPGDYTAIVRGAGGTTGVALAEIYSVPP